MYIRLHCLSTANSWRLKAQKSWEAVPPEPCGSPLLLITVQIVEHAYKCCVYFVAVLFLRTDFLHIYILNVRLNAYVVRKIQMSILR